MLVLLIVTVERGSIAVRNGLLACLLMGKKTHPHTGSSIREPPCRKLGKTR